MYSNKTLVFGFSILLLTLIIAGTSFAQYRPQPAPGQNVILYGTELTEDNLFDDTDVGDLLDDDGNIQYNVFIVPYEDGEGG